MRAILTIEVDYAPGTTTKQEARDLLASAAEHLANEGLLSGEGPAEVDEWKSRVSIDGD
jgi:hypothetical protein